MERGFYERAVPKGVPTTRCTDPGTAAETTRVFLSGVPAGTNLYGAADTLTVISSEQLLHLSAAFKQSSLEALGGSAQGQEMQRLQVLKEEQQQLERG